MEREEVIYKLAMGLDEWFDGFNSGLPTWAIDEGMMLHVRGMMNGEGGEVVVTRASGGTGGGAFEVKEWDWWQKRIELGLEKKVEEEVMSDAAQEDTGAHYRYSHRTKVSQADADRGYVDVKLDPYRICSIYQVGGGPREHIVKKGLRGLRKGDTELGLIKQLRDALDRWEEMVKEDGL